MALIHSSSTPPEVTHRLAALFWNVIRSTVDPLDYGWRNMWRGTYGQVPRRRLIEALNGRPSPKFPPLQLADIARHLNGERTIHFHGPMNYSPMRKHLICVDVDAKDPQLQADAEQATARVFELMGITGAYWEPSTGGHGRHGYFWLVPGENCRDVGALGLRLSAVAQILREKLRDEGYAAELDGFFGLPSTPQYNASGRCLSVHRGKMAKVPLLMGGDPALNAFLQTPTVSLSEIEGRTALYGIHPQQQPFQAADRGDGYEISPTSYPSEVMSLVATDSSPLRQSQGNTSGVPSSVHSQFFSTYYVVPASIPDAIRRIQTNPTLAQMYEEGRQLSNAMTGDGQRNRTHVAYTLALYAGCHEALVSPEAFLRWYEQIGYTCQGGAEKRRQRCKDVWQWRQRHSADTPYHFATCRPLVQRYVTSAMYQDLRVIRALSVSGPPPSESLVAAVLACVEHRILSCSKREHRSGDVPPFAIADEIVRQYIKTGCDNSWLPCGPGKRTQRRAALLILQLAGLIVLRSRKYKPSAFVKNGKGFGKLYGLGINHPRVAQYRQVCFDLGQRPDLVDPQSLPPMALSVAA